MTGSETRLWSRQRARQLQGLKFRRQHGIGPYIVDFYCPEQFLVIEVDGDSHADADQILKDQLRDRYFQSLPSRDSIYQRRYFEELGRGSGRFSQEIVVKIDLSSPLLTKE